MRRLHLKPLIDPSAPQLALLRDAVAGPLSRYGRFWRRSPRGTRHCGATVDSLVKRRLLAFEGGALFVTPKGRDYLARHADKAAAHAA